MFRTYPAANFYPGVTTVTLTGTVRAFDSWDNEALTVRMTAGDTVLATWNKENISFRDGTLQCPGTAGNSNWKDQWFAVEL